MTGAPVHQMLITAQFDAPIRALSALEIADLYSRYRERFPHFSQIEAAGAMPYKLEHMQGTEPLPLLINGMPRLSFGNEDQSLVVLIQQDRLSFGWNRVAEAGQDDDYIGFEPILVSFLEELGVFISWLGTSGFDVPTLKVAETVYINIFPTKDEDGQLLRLADIYSFLTKTDIPVPINGYSYTWNEKLGVADGILIVAAQGPLLMADGEHATGLTLTSTFLIADQSKLGDELLTVRARSGQTFQRLIGPKAVGR